MRKNLLIVLCFFFTQIISCGTIEAVPEATKFTMRNNSNITLEGVTWNGTNFGNISSGYDVERNISAGSGNIFFNVNEKRYRTYDLARCEKYRHDSFTFVNNTVVYNIDGAATPIYLGDVLNAE